MLKFENQNNVLIARFENTNRLNALIADQVKEELRACFKESGIKLVLDLKGISFIDSTGFGIFLSVLKTANTNAGFFKISNISPSVLELFKLLQLHNIFELYNSVEDAVESFN